MMVYMQAVALTWVRAIALLAAVAGEGRAAFIFVSESSVFNPDAHEVRFTIEFSHEPDFITTDSFGRQANSFQYYIPGDPPAEPDAASGGWGPIRGSVPFRVQGHLLTFSAPVEMLTDRYRNGAFNYEVGSFVFGALTRWENGHTIVVVPEPTTRNLLVLAGAGLFGWKYTNRRRRRALQVR
jgi:hypothetical protein